MGGSGEVGVAGSRSDGVGRGSAMRVLVLYNPIAGSGRAVKAGQGVCLALKAAGHEAVAAETRLDPGQKWLDPQLAEHELAVVVGGDGAMRLASGAASRTNTPLYHFPLGTENLFAREFGTSRSIGKLLGAIERFEVKRIDVGIANGRKFLLMASVGYDAEVANDLANRRRGAISHLTYLGPMLRQYRRWVPPRLTIDVDGEGLVAGARGCVVVANSRQYARRIDPARCASMSDGELDVVFFPVESRWDLVRWLASCLRRRQFSDARLGYRLGREVRIQIGPPQRYQLDGDRPESEAVESGEISAVSPGGVGEVSELRISLRPGVLPILLP